MKLESSNLEIKTENPVSIILETKIDKPKYTSIVNNNINTVPIIFKKKIKKSAIKIARHMHNDVGQTRYYPSAAQEWYNSVYTFNKNYLKSLPASDKTLSFLLKIYCNVWPKQNAFKKSPRLVSKIIRMNNYRGKKKYWEKRANNVRRIDFFSKRLNLKGPKNVRRKRKTLYKALNIKKVFIGKGNLKHTSDKVIITLHTYNPAKYKLLKRIKKVIYNTFLTKILLAKIITRVENKNKDENDNTIIKMAHKKKDRKVKSDYPSKYVKLFNKDGIKFKKISLFNRRLTLDEYLNSSYKYFTYYIHNPYKHIPKNSFLNKLKIIPNNFINKAEKLGKNKKYNYPLEDGSYYNNILSFTFFKINLITKNLKIILKYYQYLTLLVKNKVLNDKEKFFIFINKAHKFNVYKYRNRTRFVITKFKEKRIFLAGLLKFAWLLYINNAKFKNPVLVSKLKYLVNNLYDKEVEFNIIELKKFHLSSDIYTQLVAIKLKNRKNKLYRVLKRSLRKVNLPNISRENDKHHEFDRNQYLPNKIRNAYIDAMFKESSNINSLDNLLLNLFPTTDNLSIEVKKIPLRFTFTTNLQKYVIYNLKNGKLAGIRVEAKGRLTKRFTAQRSVFKMQYKGGLKNVDSSFKRLPAVLLRGVFKNNVEYSIVHSKNRNGAYGVKGWVGTK